MEPQAITDAAFAALRDGEPGWSLTDAGLRYLESKLDASIHAGTFADCAFEMAALTGFLAARGDATPAVEQLNALGEKFEPHLREIAKERQRNEQAQHERSSKFLGVPDKSIAPVHGQSKEGISLVRFASHELLRDPRTFASNRSKKR